MIDCKYLIIANVIGLERTLDSIELLWIIPAALFQVKMNSIG